MSFWSRNGSLYTVPYYLGTESTRNNMLTLKIGILARIIMFRQDFFGRHNMNDETATKFLEESKSCHIFRLMFKKLIM